MKRTAFCAVSLALLASTAHAQCVPAIQRLMQERKNDEAKKEMLSVLARTPDDDKAHECLGRVLMAMERPKEAAGHFEKAIKIDDKVTTHHLWLGDALGSLADSTNKIKLPFLARRIKSEFERAVALDPTSIDGRHGLIQFYSQAPGVMGGRMDKAFEQIREIAKLNSMRGHREMALLLSRDKKFAEMEREYLAARKESPDSVITSSWLGTFYEEQARWPEAMSVYDEMLRQFPEETQVHFLFGRAAAIGGLQLDRGEKELKLYIANPPKAVAPVSLAAAHHRLGMIYEKQGRKDLARAEYQTALTINPNSENAKKSLAAMK